MNMRHDINQRLRGSFPEASMFRILVILLALSVCTASAARAEILLQLVGQTQGVIDGDATFPGEENRIEISSFAHGGSVVFDPLGGAFASYWADIILTKQWDPSSIKILRAQGEEELLTVCRFRIYDGVPAARANSEGLARRMPMNFLTVELINARITSYSASAAGADNASESLTLSYDAIRYTYEANGESFLATVHGPGSSKRLAFESSGDPTRAKLPRDAFEFVLPEDGFVGIEIVDADGRRVNTLFSDDASRSDGSVRWDGTDIEGRKVPAGVSHRLHTRFAPPTPRSRGGWWWETESVHRIRNPFAREEGPPEGGPFAWRLGCAASVETAQLRPQIPELTDIHPAPRVTSFGPQESSVDRQDPRPLRNHVQARPGRDG